MLILSATDIQQVYSMKHAIEADKQALKLYSQGLSEVPLRINFNGKNGQNLFMPAHIKGSDICGLKVVSVFPNNPKLGKPAVPAQVLLLDPQTGEVCAIIDGTYLTQLRTGGQAICQLEAMLTVRPLQQIAIFDIDAVKVQQFTREMSQKFAHFGCHIYQSHNLDEDISKADIITSVTTSQVMTFNGAKIKAGAHINGVGAYTPAMHEIPSMIVQDAAVKALDTKEGVFAEAGDIIDPINEGLVKQTDFIELGELVLNPTKGRQNNQQITLFKTVGTAVLDVYVGYDIYLKAKERNIGTRL